MFFFCSFFALLECVCIAAALYKRLHSRFFMFMGFNRGFSVLTIFLPKNCEKARIAWYVNKTNTRLKSTKKQTNSDEVSWVWLVTGGNLNCFIIQVKSRVWQWLSDAKDIHVRRVPCSLLFGFHITWVLWRANMGSIVASYNILVKRAKKWTNSRAKKCWGSKLILLAKLVRVWLMPTCENLKQLLFD